MSVLWQQHKALGNRKRFVLGGLHGLSGRAGTREPDRWTGVRRANSGRSCEIRGAPERCSAGPETGPERRPKQEQLAENRSKASSLSPTFRGKPQFLEASAR